MNNNFNIFQHISTYFNIFQWFSMIFNISLPAKLVTRLDMTWSPARSAPFAGTSLTWQRTVSAGLNALLVSWMKPRECQFLNGAMYPPKNKLQGHHFFYLHLHPPCNWRTSHSGNCTMLKSLGVVRTCLAPMTSLGRKAVLENVTSFEQTAEPPEMRCLLRILREWYRKHWWKLQQATRQLSWKTMRAEHFCPDLDSAEKKQQHVRVIQSLCWW